MALQYDPKLSQTQDDPNELIAKQYMKSRQTLALQKQQAQDESVMQSQRQQAITGLSGGAAMKAQENAQRGLEQTYAGQGAALDSEEAKTKLGESQFSRQFGLSQQQFDESKKQFAQQLKLSTDEFQENQKTNFWNTMANLSKMDVPNEAWNNFFKQFKAMGKGYSTGVMPEIKNPVPKTTGFEGMGNPTMNRYG